MNTMGKILAIMALTAFGLFGLAVLLYAISEYRTTATFLDGAERGEGTVIEAGQRVVRTGSGSSRSSSTVDYAVVRFTDKDGTTQEFEQQFGLVEGCPAKGETVPIAYDPETPDVGRVTSFASLWAGLVAITVFGLVFIALGLISFKLLSS